MVEYKIKKVWQCQYCDSTYNTWEDAKSCAEECADLEYPIEVEKESYICEYCGIEHKVENNAEVCEQEHQNSEDEYFRKKGIIDAAKHPKQKKLREVLK